MRIRRLTPFTQTVASNDSAGNPAKAIHRDWDKPTGMDQTVKHTAARRAQGQKMTPIGAGTLKRTR